METFFSQIKGRSKCQGGKKELALINGRNLLPKLRGDPTLPKPRNW